MSTTESDTGHEGRLGNFLTPEEWQVRCDLAAACQLIDLYGMSDLCATHISARVPEREGRFYINPLGVLFDQMTASSLIEVDVDGRVVDGEPHQMNSAGFVIHSAVHMSRPDLVCVLHTHTRANNGVAAVEEGLLPLTQKAMLLRHVLTYHDYEGPALDGDERKRIAADLGNQGRIMILRNHGGLTVGTSIPEAWVWTYRLEMACRFQIDALSCSAAGLRLLEVDEEVVERTTNSARLLLSEGAEHAVGTLEWPSLLKKLERERGSSYRT